MLRGTDGQRLYRKVQIRVIFPDNIFEPKIYQQHAGPRQGFGEAAVLDMLLQVADQLETLYPYWDFQSVELTPIGRTARYVFNFAGYRASGADTKIESTNNTIYPIEESTKLEPEASESTAPAEAGDSLAVLVPQE